MDIEKLINLSDKEFNRQIKKILKYSPTDDIEQKYDETLTKDQCIEYLINIINQKQREIVNLLSNCRIYKNIHQYTNEMTKRNNEEYNKHLEEEKQYKNMYENLIKQIKENKEQKNQRAKERRYNKKKRDEVSQEF